MDEKLNFMETYLKNLELNKLTQMKVVLASKPVDTDASDDEHNVLVLCVKKNTDSIERFYVIGRIDHNPEHLELIDEWSNGKYFEKRVTVEEALSSFYKYTI